MERKDNSPNCPQNENVVPDCQQNIKKKSCIPVPVWKGAQTRRQVLATVSEFQQNIIQNKTEFRPTQPALTAKSSHHAKEIRQEPSISSVSGCRNEPGKTSRSAECWKSNGAATKSRVHFKPDRGSPETSVVASATEVAKKKPGNFPEKLVSLVEEQQQSGIAFQKDSNALRSILTDSGISISTMATLSEMFKPQRATEGQGRPVYTPSKHAVQMRNSVYTREPRMSLTDSCNQYKKFLRQTRGLEEESESGSPFLARAPPKVTVSESPLVKGMKRQSVKGSVYPKWSHHNLLSPFIHHSSTSQLEKQMMNETDKGKEELGTTPKTPLTAFRRVPVTPLSSRHKGNGGFENGTPGTPSIYSRVAVTPARRVPVLSSSKTQLGASSQKLESAKKRLKWADILDAYSPDLQHTEQTTQQVPASGYTKNMTNSRDCVHGEESTSYRPTSASEKQGSSWHTTYSTGYKKIRDESSVPCLRPTQLSLDVPQSLLSSVSGLSARLHPVSEWDEENAQPTEERTTASTDSYRSAAEQLPVDVRQSQVAWVTHDPSATTTSQDIIHHLQVPDHQEDGIQNEMQPVEKTMWKDQEGESSARNAVEHYNQNQCQTGQAPKGFLEIPIMNQNRFPDDTTSPIHFVLQAPRFDLPGISSCDPQSVSMPVQELVSSNVSAPSSHEICCTSSSVGDSASSSYNIRSNVKNRHLHATDLMYPQDNISSNTALLDQDAGDAYPDIWPTRYTTTLVSKRKLRVCSQSSTSGDKDGDQVGLHVMSANVKETYLHPGLDSVSSSSPVSPNGGEHYMEYEETIAKKVSGTFDQLCSRVSGVKFCGIQEEIDQQEVASRAETVESDDNRVWVSSSLNLPHQRQLFQANMPVMENVFMEADEKEDEAGEMNRTSRFARQVQAQTSPSLLSGTLSGGQKAPKVNPVAVIVRPRVLSPSLPASHHTTSLHVSPPLWTTLALQSAAAQNRILRIPQNMESEVSDSSNIPEQDVSLSPLSKKVETSVITLSDSVSPLQGLMTQDSISGENSHLPERHALRPHTSLSKRCPLHGTLRQKQGRRHSSAVKNPDVFLEALLEDECALYAGRLQSFFKDLKTVCDRQESPDPVAKTLTEGDDMHFLPICDDSAFSHPRSAALQHSAFTSYIAG